MEKKERKKERAVTGCAPAPTWEVEMFRGLRERRGDRPAVGPER